MAKFKKLAIVSSAVLMTTAFAFGVAACGEEACAHTYEKKSNETHTWYACTQDGCDSVVGKEEIHVHNYVKKNDETHTWYACDKEGCDSVVAKEEIVTPHVHTFTLKNNDTKHWYECSDSACAEKVGEAEHIWNEGEETLAAGLLAGEKTYTCLACGKTEIEPIDANPLIVAEGSAVGANYYDKVITVALEAGDYIAITNTENVTGSQFTVDEAGDVDVYFSVFDIFAEENADVAFNYTIKKVPSVTLDYTLEEAQEEIVTFGWVKVSMEIPQAGKYAIAVENAVVSSYAGEGQEYYVFNTTEAEETATFYVKANESEESEEKYANVAIYWAALEATELSAGANELPLWGFTATDVTFTAPAAGTYKFVTYDSSLAFYKVYDDANWDYQLFNKLNNVYYFEAAEADEVISFSILGWYDVATFAIEEFPDEERYTSVVAFNELGEGYANLKAGSTATLQLPMAMMMNVGMVTWDNADVTLSIDNNGSALTATTQKVAFKTPFGETAIVTNTAEEDIELTFTLALLNGMDGVVDSTVEVYVPASGGSPMNTVSLYVQLSAGTYTASVSSSTITSASYNGTALGTTEVEVTATGNIDRLNILGANENAEMVVVTIEAASSGNEPATNGTGVYGDPYILPAIGASFSNLALHQNPRSGVYYACFSFTAEQDGLLTVANITVSEITAGNSPMQPTNEITVSAGVEYTIMVTTDTIMSTASPVFTFTAAV